MTGRRAGVHTLAPSVRGLKLHPVAHRFLNRHFQGVIIGVTLIRQIMDLAIMVVDSRRRIAKVRIVAGYGIRIGLIAYSWNIDVSDYVDLRIEISSRRQRRRRDIRIIGPEGFVHAPRAYVTHHRGHVADQFTLDIEVPLHDVTAMGILLGVTPAFFSPAIANRRGKRYYIAQCS